MTNIKYHPAAEDELMNEIGYLELRVPGLGRRFHAEVRKAESFIGKFPRSGHEISPGIRKHLLRKFPFSLIYSVETGGLLILAVAHHRRRPRYWIRRARQSES